MFNSPRLPPNCALKTVPPGWPLFFASVGGGGLVSSNLSARTDIARDTRTGPALLRFAGAVEQAPEIVRWLDAQPSELGSIARTWFARMRRCGSNVRELMHDGYATVCVEDAPFAYVGVFRAHVNVGFFHGAALPDHAGLLQGTGKYMRHVRIEPGRALDAPSLEALITSAYRDIGARLERAR